MSNWEETTLDKLGSLETGKQKAKKHSDSSLFIKGTIPLIDGKEVSASRLHILKCRKYYNKMGKNQSKIFPPNTVCLVRCGSSGDSAILKLSCCLSDKIYGFSSFEKVSDPKFIKYCLTFKETKEQLISLANSSTAQPVLSFKKLSLLKLFVPKFQTQKKIGDILSSYDELIENHERQIELLEKLKTTLYKEWFISLRFPNYEKSLVKDGIPEGWKILKLKDIATIQKGKIAAGKENPKGAYPFFTSSKDSPKKIDRYSYDTVAILLTSARYFVANLYRGKFEASDGCYILNSKDNSLIFFLLEMIRFTLPILEAEATGTNYKTLKKEQLEEISFYLPNIEEINKFNLFCEDIQSKIEKLDAKKRKN